MIFNIVYVLARPNYVGENIRNNNVNYFRNMVRADRPSCIWVHQLVSLRHINLNRKRRCHRLQFPLLLRCNGVCSPPTSAPPWVASCHLALQSLHVDGNSCYSSARRFLIIFILIIGRVHQNRSKKPVQYSFIFWIFHWVPTVSTLFLEVSVAFTVVFGCIGYIDRRK